MTDELRRVKDETLVTYSVVLWWHSPGGTKEHLEEAQHNLGPIIEPVGRLSNASQEALSPDQTYSLK
jgi:hypothetical protein